MSTRMHRAAAKTFESSRTDSMKNGTGQRRMGFIDLLPGLGGFFLALRKLDHGCVFAGASESPLREPSE